MITLSEWLKNAREEFWFHADPCVMHSQDNLFGGSFLLERNGYDSAGAGEFICIMEDIADGLRQSGPISHHPHRPVGYIHFEMQVVRFKLGAIVPHGLTHKRGKITEGLVEFHLAARDS